MTVWASSLKPKYLRMSPGTSRSYLPRVNLHTDVRHRPWRRARVRAPVGPQVASLEAPAGIHTVLPAPGGRCLVPAVRAGGAMRGGGAAAGVWLKRRVRMPDAQLVSRRSKQLVLVTVIVVAGFAVRNLASEPRPVPAVPGPQTGLLCFRQGGDHDYCQCLDRLESARSVTGHATSALPPLDHPTIRYALRHPRLYPIINSDTLRCLAPRVPDAPGVFAGMNPALAGVGPAP
jgi:hypothetical protein